MGFKLSSILVNEGHDGHIGEMARSPVASQTNSARAAEILDALRLAKNWESMGCPGEWSPLEDGQIDVGVYEGACVIDPGIQEIEYCLRDPTRPILANLCRLFPSARILAATIYDVVNLYGYLYFENGRLVRAHGGGDGEIMIDRGELLPEEGEWFDRSHLCDGERLFRDPETNDEFTVHQIGGELVCAVSRRFLGQSFEDFEFGDLQIERFRKKRNPVLRWLMGK
jgi:hypothetical protein